MPYVQVQDGTELYYYDWGTGAPVILIHGWPLTSASWEYQARVLAENGFRVVAYDRRGFGRSGWPYSGYNYQTLAADLNTLLETLNLTGATLVGFSMGGGEVARYIGTYGESRIAKTVFISAVTPYLLKTDDNPEGVDKKVFEEIEASLKADRPAFLSQFGPMFYGRSMVHHTVSEPFLDFTQAMALTASPKATLDLAHAWSETDFRDDLAKITVPTLVVHGTGDATVPIDASGRRTAQLVAHSELIEYDGAPHGLTATHASKLNADLLSFLRSS